MKKSLLSIVLSLAIVMTAFGAMFAMPASALNGVDFLAEGAPTATDGLSYQMVDDALVITATAAGQELALTIEGEANLNDYPFWEATIDSEIPFDVAIYDPNNSKWMFAAGDFCYNFDNNNGPSQPIPAGTHNVKFTLTGAYTWTGAPLPANAAVKSITFIAKAAGTITIAKCAMTDGISDVKLGEGNTWNDAWTVEPLATDNAADWVGAAPDKSGDSEIIVNYNEADARLEFGNTAGNWPSASLEVNKTVDYATSAINVDVNVLSGAQTTLYVFFGDATPDEFEGEGKAYGAIVADVSAGNYSGIVMLSDILDANADVIDADGKVKVSYVKIFATSGGTVMNPAVYANNIDLCYVEEAPLPEGLGDIDADEDIDTMDALYVYQAANGRIQLTREQYANADWNGDGEITNADAQGVFNYVAGR